VSGGDFLVACIGVLLMMIGAAWWGYCLGFRHMARRWAAERERFQAATAKQVEEEWNKRLEAGPGL
jgi:hypothetical protein